MPRHLSTPDVTVNVTAARRQLAREAITIGGGAFDLNPAQARALADDLTAASELVDRLMPPKELGSYRPATVDQVLTDLGRCAQAGHCVNDEPSCALDAARDDHPPRCCSCDQNLPVVAK